MIGLKEASIIAIPFVTLLRVISILIFLKVKMKFVNKVQGILKFQINNKCKTKKFTILKIDFFEIDNSKY